MPLLLLARSGTRSIEGTRPTEALFRPGAADGGPCGDVAGVKGAPTIGDGERPERTKKEKCSSAVFVCGVSSSVFVRAQIWRIERIVRRLQKKRGNESLRAMKA